MMLSKPTPTWNDFAPKFRNRHLTEHYSEKQVQNVG